jgi:hypothetical protein
MSSIIVCGGRDFVDYPHLEERINAFRNYIKQLHNHEVSLIIHGGARGADSLAQDYAVNYNIPYQMFPAHWNAYGKAAGFRRNEEMLRQNPSYVIGFYGGRGTAHMINISMKQGVPTFHIK